jgi:hypothetical protein
MTPLTIPFDILYEGMNIIGGILGDLVEQGKA